MDFTKLTPEEIDLIIQEKFPGYNINNPYEKVADMFRVVSGNGSYPAPIVDLYISHLLHNNGIVIPSDYNVYDLPNKDFLELANVYYLPQIDDRDIRERAARITRILIDMKKSPYQPRELKIELTPASPYMGDFLNLINRVDYQHTLFIFDENQEDFVKFVQYAQSDKTKLPPCDAIFPGIQQFQCQEIPKAVGIPVGTFEGGYQDIITALPYIESALEYIRELLKTGQYSQVIYPSEHDGRTFRPTFIHPSPEIKEYIVNSLEDIIRH